MFSVVYEIQTYRQLAWQQLYMNIYLSVLLMYVCIYIYTCAPSKFFPKILHKSVCIYVYG